MTTVISVLILFFAALFQTAGETEATPESERSLEELCAEYHQLSDQLTRDYIAVQNASIESEQTGDLLSEIKANSNYTKTRIAFKKVVRELGTRSCPVDMKEDFPPLVDE